VKKTHDYIHRHRGYWADRDKCHICIYTRSGAPARPEVGEPSRCPEGAGDAQVSLEIGSLEDRLRKLEEQLIRQPSAEAYLEASNREQVRALHALAERLEKYRLDGDYLFVEANLRMLAEDTPEKWERDCEIIEAWHTAQGMDRVSEVEGAGKKLLARLEA
jgi:hypothetical protein